MSKIINLKHGLDIPLKGAAGCKTSTAFTFGEVALKPSDFRALTPKLLVKEGDSVKAGDPLFACKSNLAIQFTSPVSGTVSAIVRGDRRKVLSVNVTPAQTQEFKTFAVEQTLSREALTTLLLESGLWPCLKERPYGIIADPAATPKAIFVSAFSSAPLAADTEIILSKEDVEDVQKAVDALGLIAGVHVGLDVSKISVLSALKGVQLHQFQGRHPFGNVGVQIHHVCPIRKGEKVWTITPQELVFIGRLLRTGKVDLRKKVAVVGPACADPCYVNGIVGMQLTGIKALTCGDNVRTVSGDALTGTAVAQEGFLGFHDQTVTLLREGNDYELLGWANPFRFKLFSASRTYFSWLCPKKEYDLDTNLHGGVRAFVLSDAYSKVLPMDLYPIYLIKACLAGDIDKMEQFGIYEVLEEDLALCEYIDPCKNEIQEIISEGISLMLKEMA